MEVRRVLSEGAVTAPHRLGCGRIGATAHALQPGPQRRGLFEMSLMGSGV